MAQLVKNLPVMWETWVRSLGREDPLEKGTAIHSCILAWRIPWTVACQAPLSMGFLRQAYWSGLPVPSLGDLPDPGIAPGSPALQADASPSEPPGKPTWNWPSAPLGTGSTRDRQYLHRPQRSGP